MSSPRKKSIQHWAHALTVISLFWMLFSAFAVFDWFGYHRTINDPNAIPDFVIWSAHLLLIGLTVHLFRTEKKREVFWMGDDDEILEPVPQQVNLVLERSVLTERFLNDLKQLPGFAFILAIYGGLMHLIGYSSSGQVGEPIATVWFLGFCFLLMVLRTVSRPIYYYTVAVRRNRAFQKQQQSSITPYTPLEQPPLQ